MEVLITKKRNGRYIVSHPKFPPTIIRVYGTRLTEAYVTPGDPVGLNDVCNLPLRIMKSNDLDVFDRVRADVTMKFIEKIRQSV